MNLDDDLKEKLDLLFSDVIIERKDFKTKLVGKGNVQCKTIRCSHSKTEISPEPGFRILYDKDTIYIQQSSNNLVRIKRIVTNCFGFVNAITGFPKEKSAIDFTEFANAYNLSFHDDPGIREKPAAANIPIKKDLGALGTQDKGREESPSFALTAEEKKLIPILNKFVDFMK